MWSNWRLFSQKGGAKREQPLGSEFEDSKRDEALRSCRFFGFGELGPSREAVAVTWARLRTNVVSGLVVVGRDGFRPEDARWGGWLSKLDLTSFNFKPFGVSRVMRCTQSLYGSNYLLRGS